jgi:DNA-binding NtrC family response regulator
VFDQRPPESLHREAILLIEDEELVRTIIRLALTRDGYRVIEASSSAQASRLWDENAPAIRLVVADLHLEPDAPSGLELIEQFRQFDPNLRALLTTGNMVADGKELSLPPYCELLRKPFDLAKLAAAVRRTLDKQCAA